MKSFEYFIVSTNSKTNIHNGAKTQELVSIVLNGHWKNCKSITIKESNTMQSKKLEPRIYLANSVHSFKLISNPRLKHHNSKNTSLATRIIMLFALVMGMKLMILI